MRIRPWDAHRNLHGQERNASSAMMRVLDQDRAASRFAAARAAGFDRLLIDADGKSRSLGRRIGSRLQRYCSKGRPQHRADRSTATRADSFNLYDSARPAPCWGTIDDVISVRAVVDPKRVASI
jgi:hypothetical protein